MIDEDAGGTDGGWIADENVRRRLYDDVFRPAARDALYGIFPGDPNQGAALFNHFPLDYVTGMAALPGRGDALTTRQMPVLQLNDFASFYLQRLADEFGEAAARGAFFLHEIQGVKLGYPHAPSDERQRREQLEEVMSVFMPHCRPYTDVPWLGEHPDSDTDSDGDHPNLTRNRDGVDSGEVWVLDVALQWAVEGHVVHWRTDGHHMGWAAAFPGAAPVERNLNFSSRRVDRAGTLWEVSGWYYARGANDALRNEPALSAIFYCTDKNLWYNRTNAAHDGLYAKPSPAEMQTAEGFAKFDARTTKVIQHLARGAGRRPNDDDADANDDDDDHDGELRGQDGAARFEVRVPFGHALSVLVNVPPDFKEMTLGVFPSEVWWCAFPARSARGDPSLISAFAGCSNSCGSRRVTTSSASGTRPLMSADASRGLCPSSWRPSS
jgi:hypothetical protein